MSAAGASSGGTGGPRTASRRVWRIAGAGALTLALLGAGIGIGALIWSGGSTTRSVPAANNAAPGNGPEPNTYEVKLQSTWSVSQPTHVVLEANAPLQCTRNQKTVTFDVTPPTSTRDNDVLFLTANGDACGVKTSSNWITVTATNASGKRDRRINLYQQGAFPAISSDYAVNCDGGSLDCTQGAALNHKGTVTFTWR